MEHYNKGIVGWMTFDRLYKDMVAKFPDGSKFVEVGTYTGKSFCYLLVEMVNSGKKFNVAAVDSFTFSGDDGRNILDIFVENADKANYPYTTIVGQSDLSADAFEDQSLDFVFIDADHIFTRCFADINSWLPKIKPGGIIAGHDYCKEHPGVIEAVDKIFGEDWNKNYLDELCWVKEIK